jgi:hypothetical protein
MFDPNSPLPDFQQQQVAAKRQRDMADALRSLGQGSRPQGQMVGQHYVAPSLFETLTPALTTFMGAYSGDKANQIDAQSAEQAAAAKNDWYNTLPQTTPGRAELQGPPEQGGSPELAAIPDQRPSRESVLKATIAGMNIPGNKDAALAYNKGMGEELTREDNQLARREDKEMVLAQQKWAESERLKQRAEEAQRRAEDQRLSREERERAAREMIEWRDRHDKVLLELGRIRADSVGANKTPKPLAQAVHKSLSSLDAVATTMTSMKDTFKPEYGSVGGLAKTMMGTYLPGANTDAAEWWKNYRKESQLAERHSMFGTALTAAERGAWRNADIEPYMNPVLIQRNLETRRQLAEKLYEKARLQFKNGGHNVDDAFPSRGADIGTPGAPGAPKAAPASGSKTINGKTYIQKDGQWYEQ